MRLNIVKSKNAEQLYIIKSFRKGSKNTSRIFKKLGTMDELLPKYDNDREKVLAWAKEQAQTSYMQGYFLRHQSCHPLNICRSL